MLFHSHHAAPAFALALLGAILAIVPPQLAAAGTDPGGASGPAVEGPFVLLGWNDLGMHCSNRNFADLAVLPPFNTVWATLIRRGDENTLPQVLGNGYSVSYEIEENTYSVGKTDFWTYAYALFGIQLPDNIGLLGKGLTGTLDWKNDHFDAVGIPLTPFTDADLAHEQPYQLARLTAFDGQGGQIATTEIVAPVSNEMVCADCHHPNAGETVEHAILRRHDAEEETNLANQRPVLCADCHGSNALGMPGNPNLPSLSLAMHRQHAEETDDCYQCHPGPNTQCLRDVMSQQHGMVCQDCHGHVADVAQSIENGRQPWLEEPRCGDCHGENFSEAPDTLYRNSKNGHGGLYCESCHSSPHAILPSREERDNRQNLVLQGFEGTVRRCDVCHGTTPSGPGPHGLFPTGLSDPAPAGALSAQVFASPNPVLSSTEIHYRVVDDRPIRLAVYDAAGRTVRLLTARSQTPGDHALVWDGRDADGRTTPAGVYFCRLSSGGETASVRIVKVGS